MTFTIPFLPIPMIVFPFLPIPIVVFKNVPSRNNKLIPIPALSVRNSELVMIT